jgi:hypothetical protein
MKHTSLSAVQETSCRLHATKQIPHALEELRSKNRRGISAFSGEEFQRVNDNVFHGYTECILSGVQRFSHIRLSVKLKTLLTPKRVIEHRYESIRSTSEIHARTILTDHPSLILRS